MVSDGRGPASGLGSSARPRRIKDVAIEDGDVRKAWSPFSRLDTARSKYAQLLADIDRLETEIHEIHERFRALGDAEDRGELRLSKDTLQLVTEIRDHLSKADILLKLSSRARLGAVRPKDQFLLRGTLKKRAELRRILSSALDREGLFLEMIMSTCDPANLELQRQARSAADLVSVFEAVAALYLDNAKARLGVPPTDPASKSREARFSELMRRLDTRIEALGTPAGVNNGQ